VISFNCPQCEKGFLLPNRRAGETTWCPACGQELLVPPPQERSSRRRRWLVPALLALIAIMVAVMVAVGTRQADQSATVRARFATRLHSSPEWQGIAWQKCEPDAGDYELSALYFGKRGVYTLQVKQQTALGQTFVVVDPRAGAPPWLAQGRFQHGVAIEFDYSGRDSEEKELLERVSKEIAQALQEALD
jgi:hypothetical protein